MTRGKLIVISGPSGVGKDTVTRAAIDKLDNIALSVSHTTRTPRPREVNGVDYHFVGKINFCLMGLCGQMLECAEYNGNMYGTSKSEVNAKLDAGQDVVLIIETQGAANIKKKMPEAKTIFLAPPSIEELESRLRKRGTETEEAIQNRMNTAKDEIKLASTYDYIIVNKSKKKCIDELAELIMSFRKD